MYATPARPSGPKVLGPDVGAGLVPQRPVQRAPEARLVEVAAHPHDVREVDGTLDAEAAKRSEDAALDRLEPVEGRGHRAEHLLHVAGGGGGRRGEAGERRVLRPVEQPPGLRAERGVRLVADDQADAVPLHRVLVAKARLVGRDRHAMATRGLRPVEVVGDAGEVADERGGGLVGEIAAGHEDQRRHVEGRRERAEGDRLARSRRRVDPGAARAHVEVRRELVERLELVLAQRDSRPGGSGVGEGRPECVGSRVGRDGCRFGHALTTKIARWCSE